MLYNKLKERFPEIKQYTGLTSLYQIRKMRMETIDEKMELLILLIKYLNGFKVSVYDKDVNKRIPLAKHLYDQSLSNAISLHMKDDVVGGCIKNMVMLLVNDLNFYSPEKPVWELLSNILDSRTSGDFEILSYDNFFTKSLTDEEFQKAEEKKMNGELLGDDPLDWKYFNFRFTLIDGKEVYVKSFSDLNGFTKVDLLKFIEEELNKEGSDITGDLRFIYENKDLVNKRNLMAFLRNLLRALLFSQTYDKYDILQKGYDDIKAQQ